MTAAVTYTLVTAPASFVLGESWWEARREGQAAPVGYGDDQRDAYEALLRAERREATT